MLDVCKSHPLRRAAVLLEGGIKPSPALIYGVFPISLHAAIALLSFSKLKTENSVQIKLF